MTLSAIHNEYAADCLHIAVVCDIGGYDFVSYSQHFTEHFILAGCCL